MEQRLTMIMVGAKDIATLRRFYEEGLGWAPCRAGGSGSVMYKVGHSVLVFLPIAYLAKDRGEELAGGTNASLAVFLSSREAVDDAVEKAVRAGARITSHARDRDGGLYSAYFSDPEGNSWEVVWAPKMTMSEGGELVFN
jgi:predicted enzyme related to lactoylglutathione lyase